MLLKQALKDAAFHRAKFYKLPLYAPQIEAIQKIEKHLDGRTGKVLTYRSSRQTGKNEISATVEARALVRYQREGGAIVKVAPTYKPQIVNSKRRLDQLIRKDPLFLNKPRGYREGYIKELGNCSIQFLSGEKGSNVEGATASLLLEIDEAHKIDKGKFEEAFAPMTASTAAATVMYGVAAAKSDLLYEQRMFNEANDPDLNIQFPASVWCEILPSYAKHYEERVKKLGKDHPVILTQYDLIDIDSSGGFLGRHQQALLLSGDHQRRISRTDEPFIGITIDIAGEDEEGEELGQEKGESSRDQTVAMVWSVDYSRKVNEIPEFKLLDVYWWVGAQLSAGPSGLPGQQEKLLQLIRAWKADKVIIDGRGVGEQIAAYLTARHGAVETYKADKNSVSDDCYSLLAFINNAQVKVFRDDHSADYQELVKQIGHTAKEIKDHDKMKIVKPNNDNRRHIDMVKATTYIHRLLDSYVIGAL